MKVFLDTNVVLDLLAKRVPFFEAAAEIVTLALEKRIELYVSSLSFVTVYYLLCKHEPGHVVKDKLKKFASVSSFTSVDSSTILASLNSGMKDFEDAVQSQSALEAGVALIVTRNVKDFRASSLQVMTPDEFLSAFLNNNKS